MYITRGGIYSSNSVTNVAWNCDKNGTANIVAMKSIAFNQRLELQFLSSDKIANGAKPAQTY